MVLEMLLAGCCPGNRMTTVLVLLMAAFVLRCSAQLVVNVQNMGGEVVQETIEADTGDDLITLEFQRSDGTLITQIIDFRKEVQVLKALVLGEEERGQSQYQVMCFLTKLQRNDFISSDAVTKLRQKNPNTVRTPDENRGWENYTMTARVNIDLADAISPHVRHHCAEAKDATFVRDVDLKAFAEHAGTRPESIQATVVPFPVSAPSRCGEVLGLWVPCICSLEVCIGWYPCGLRYCRGKSTDHRRPHNNASVRCGINTCRKCSHFRYYVPEKQHCLWDD